MAISIKNKTGSIKTLMEDLQEKYTFKEVTEDGKYYLSDSVYFALESTDSSDTLYIKNGSFSQKIFSGTALTYCIAVTDTGFAFGSGSDTLEFFVGKTVSSDGTESVGFVGRSSSSTSQLMFFTDDMTSSSVIAAPRSSTVTSSSQLQLFPAMSPFGTEVFSDVYIVYLANQTATNWKNTDVSLNGERFYVSKYLALRFEE